MDITYITDINIISINARSVKEKITEIQARATEYDVICITETHLDNTFLSSQPFSPLDKVTYRKDKNLHGGVVY